VPRAAIHVPWGLRVGLGSKWFPSPVSANVARGGSNDRSGKVPWTDGVIQSVYGQQSRLVGPLRLAGTMVGGDAMHPCALLHAAWGRDQRTERQSEQGRFGAVSGRY
jgi:hypothetical protein